MTTKEEAEQMPDAQAPKEIAANIVEANHAVLDVEDRDRPLRGMIAKAIQHEREIAAKKLAEVTRERDKWAHESQTIAAELNASALKVEQDFRDAHAKVEQDRDAAREEAKALRARLDETIQLLWLRHGCPISSLYGDDGEMQCNTCMIDFKRLEPAEIRAVWEARNKVLLVEAAKKEGA